MDGGRILLSVGLALALATAARGLHRARRSPMAGESGRAAAAAEVSSAALAFLAWLFLLKILPLLAPATGLLRRDFLFPLWALWRGGNGWWWLLPAAAAGIGLLLAPARLRRPPLFLAGGAGLAAVLWLALALTNGGWPEGVVEPFTRDADYYADVARFPPGSPLWSAYVERQPELSLHGRTHPPGAVALLRVLEAITGGRLPWIALAVSGLGLLGLLPMLALARMFLAPAAARAAAGLWLVTPAVCLYGTVSMDMVFALPLLAGAALWVAALLAQTRAAGAARAGGAGLLLAAGFTLTFSAAVAALGWAAATLWLPRQERRAAIERLAVCAATCVSALVLLSAASGFDALACLRTAMAIDGELAPAFLSPRYYGLTRLMGALDFLVLAGVAVSPAWLRALGRSVAPGPPGRGARRDRLLLALSRGAAVAALLFLAAGAYKIGETGRIWMFLLPWVLLPAVRCLAAAGAAAGAAAVSALWPVQVAAAWGLTQALLMEWLLDTRW